MFGPKIRVDKDLLEECKRHAREGGYSSVEEFITHTLEKEIGDKRKQTEEDENEIIERLKELDYI